MNAVPNYLKDIEASASLLFLTLHVDTAEHVVHDGSLPVLGDMLKSQSVTLGVGRFHKSRAARQLPRPWAATLAEFVPLEMTPCTRAAFASVTGQNGAVRVDRRDIVSICIAHEKLRSLGRPLVYADRLCTRDDVRFSGDRDLLKSAAWDRIKSRDFRPDSADPAAVHRYDAAVLVWGAIATSVVGSIICKDDGAAEAFRRRCPQMHANVIARGQLLW